MSRILATIRLIRPLNCLFAGTAVWVGAYTTLAPMALTPVILTALCAFLLCAAGNIDNDSQDIKTDSIAHPDRELVRGRLSVGFATRLLVVCDTVAVALSCMVGLSMLFSVLAVIVLLYAYNRWLKRLPLVGNLVAALVASATFLGGGLASSPFALFVLPGPLIGGAFAFVVHTMRELVKDIQDVEGDRAAGIKTLPARLGARPVLIIVALLGFVLAWGTYQPYWQEWYGIQYWRVVYAGVLPLSLGVSLAAVIRSRPRVIAFLAGSLKVSMALGLVALLLA